MQTLKRNIVAIGGSLGSIEAVRQLCINLPKDFGASVFIVIHVGAGGHNLLAGIFDSHCPLPVRTAVDGEPVRENCMYVAPADHHMLVINDVIRLGRGPRENLARPAIDPLFRSIALNYGPRAIGVVLTGLLNDGAAGLADIKRCGGLTVVQNPRTAEAPSMPLGALEASEVDYRADVADLPYLLASISNEEVDPRFEAPDDIRLEVNIAMGQRSAPSMDRLAVPTGLTCPDCGGVLSEMHQQPPLRYRCQVGHAYTAQNLAARKEESVDEAMRVALRIVEERVLLIRRMAEDARRNGHVRIAKDTDERAHELELQAEALRRAV